MLNYRIFPQGTPKALPKVVPIAQRVTPFDRETMAVVTAEISPQEVGQVKFQGSWWNAISTHPETIAPGALVRVCYPLKLPLRVVPL